MSRLEMIPQRLMAPQRVTEVVVFIRDLPGREIDRKELLAEWCSEVGCRLTKELVEQVYGGEGHV